MDDPRWRRGSMICPLHAWGDESIRSHGLDAPAYLLGASVVDSDDVEAAREVLESLRPTNGKLHWHDLGRPERRRVGEAVEALEALHLVVVATPVDLRREERARAVCLERLGWELARHDVSLLTLESRASALVARDLRVVEALRGRRVIPKTLRVEHGAPRSEPMLWLPDQLLGMFGEAMTTGKPLSDSITDGLETFEVRP